MRCEWPLLVAEVKVTSLLSVDELSGKVKCKTGSGECEEKSQCAQAAEVAVGLSKGLSSRHVSCGRMSVRLWRGPEREERTLKGRRGRRLRVRVRQVVQ